MKRSRNIIRRSGTKRIAVHNRRPQSTFLHFNKRDQRHPTATQPRQLPNAFQNIGAASREITSIKPAQTANALLFTIHYIFNPAVITFALRSPVN
ncbi:hypothetical protein KCP69_03695 [Salmonella enterica subsp. enterica]|nr:hypothetical protein KCP69_03695 [Salmonella enterica subsp. enterica]